MARTSLGGVLGGDVKTPDVKALVMDSVAFSLNISSSVLIIFVNKKLMDPVHGCGFVFGEPRMVGGGHMCLYLCVCVCVCVYARACVYVCARSCSWFWLHLCQPVCPCGWVGVSGG